MKVRLSELKTFVSDVITEAGKAKKKGAKGVINPPEHVARPAQFKYASPFDMSQPLGKDNLYRREGGSNWGPQTSSGQEDIDGSEARAENRATKPVGYQEGREFSAWDTLVEERLIESEPKGVWETLQWALYNRPAGK